MGNFNKDQFFDVLKGGYENPEHMEEDPDYLMSFVECDNCGKDTHMDNAIIVKPTPSERKQGNVTNYYCGEDCTRVHQAGPRKGKIGNGLHMDGQE